MNTSCEYSHADLEEAFAYAHEGFETVEAILRRILVRHPGTASLVSAGLDVVKEHKLHAEVFESEFSQG